MSTLWMFDKACSLDVLHEEVSRRDVLRPLVEAELVAEAECRCAVGEDVNR